MLIGHNLILRPLRLSDGVYLNKWRSNINNKVMTQGYRLPVTEIQDENWLRLKMGSTQPNEIYFMVDEGETPIGLIQLNKIDYVSGTADWGFIIGDETRRGRGFSVEAPRLLFGYAFNILNLRKITSYNLSINKATLRMHQKIGTIHEEGRLVNHYFLSGEYHDVIILSAFRSDFPELYPANDHNNILPRYEAGTNSTSK